jgi:general secretion pathway protein I
MRTYRARTSNGFTLIETLIAMVMISFGLMVLANSWSGNVVRLQKSRINSNIASLLQRKMTEIEVLYQDKPLDVPEDGSGDFGASFPEYFWELKSKEFEMPDLSSLLTAKDGGADEISLMIAHSVTEYIKKSVREVTVTVVYKGAGTKGHDLRNAVTSYFVDYTKDVPLPEGMGGGNGGDSSADGSGTPADSGSGTK